MRPDRGGGRANQVVQGDCLEALAGLPAGSVDLLYADPPFGTGKDWGAFDDRWQNGLDGYLEWMRPRLEAIWRALAETGSLYLHCDPTASHYLKVMLDDLFGRANFRNEVVWCYAGGAVPILDWPRKHDIILRYAGEGRTFNVERRVYGPHNLTGRRATSRDGTRPVDYHPAGTPVNDWWTDIQPVINWSSEECGYPTQKPVALLERIVRASSNQGDLVADPFCGSGTTLVAAKRLGRRWWGCDLNPQAVTLTERRLAAETAPLPGMAGG